MANVGKSRWWVSLMAALIFSSPHRTVRGLGDVPNVARHAMASHASIVVRAATGSTQRDLKLTHYLKPRVIDIGRNDHVWQGAEVHRITEAEANASAHAAVFLEPALGLEPRTC